MAARKNTKTRAPRVEALDLNPRHLWLAALGAVAAARRGTAGAIHEAGLRSRITTADVRHALRKLDADARTGIESLSDRVQPWLCPIGRTVQAGIAPIAQRVGLDIGPQHAALRKAAPKATPKATRRAVRKAAPAAQRGKRAG